MLSNKFISQGNWLFRWRSFFPLLLAPALIFASMNSADPYVSPLVDELTEVFCFLVVAFGLLIRAYAVGCAPRGTSTGTTSRPRAVSLNVTGAYSVIRHPLYVGNYFMWLGIAMFTQSFILIALFSVFFCLYYERIMMAEEAFLAKRFGETYREWAAKTPAIVPNPKLWVPAAHPFDWRRVVVREYSGIFAVISLITLMELISDSAAEGAFILEWDDALVFGLGAAAYLAIMYTKRRTQFFR